MSFSPSPTSSSTTPWAGEQCLFYLSAILLNGWSLFLASRLPIPAMLLPGLRHTRTETKCPFLALGVQWDGISWPYRNHFLELDRGAPKGDTLNANGWIS